MAAQSTARRQTRTTSTPSASMDNSAPITTPDYAHKKFSALKRKRSQDEETDDDVVFIMELPAKRRFFRPWLDEPRATVTSATAVEQPPRRPSPNTVATTYHANMVRSHTPRLRSPKAQQRRDRNTLACLLSRRARQAKQLAMEQQYEQFRQQHEANLEQQVRLSLYYVRFLQQTMAATRAALPHSNQQSLQHGQPTLQAWPQQQAAATKR
ncbi:PREDICTED: uncharacterized protein LOC108609571 [Drosophila arizonae]|uniref:Uncharacterized protein LOC108609571 n=1 Tax=Drosophila arizonae TaxID=7263 RepID=A0ABM1NP94_DROAR|nr:PREDICTED: uncharacterized protein LOC108609571 [Drosophila arizonae]